MDGTPLWSSSVGRSGSARKTSLGRNPGGAKESVCGQTMTLPFAGGSDAGFPKHCLAARGRKSARFLVHAQMTSSTSMCRQFLDTPDFAIIPAPTSPTPKLFAGWKTAHKRPRSDTSQAKIYGRPGPSGWLESPAVGGEGSWALSLGRRWSGGRGIDLSASTLSREGSS